MNATATADYVLLLYGLWALLCTRGGGAFFWIRARGSGLIICGNITLSTIRFLNSRQKSVLPLPFLQQPHRPEGVFFEGVFCFFEAEEVSFSSATLGGGLGGGELFAAGPETTQPLR